MTDKEYKEQKARTEKFIKKWFDAMGLGWWQVDISFSRHLDEDLPDALAVTRCLWAYRKAAVDFYLPNVQSVDDEKLESNIVHEFVHILMWPLWDQVEEKDERARQINEYTTESVKNALLWVEQHAKKEKSPK